MDKDQLIEKLDSSHLYYDNGYLRCQVCYVSINANDFRYHRQWHINEFDSLVFWVNKLQEIIDK